MGTIKYKGEKYLIIKCGMKNKVAKGFKIEDKKEGHTIISVNKHLPKWEQQRAVHSLIKDKRIKNVAEWIKNRCDKTFNTFLTEEKRV